MHLIIVTADDALMEHEFVVALTTGPHASLTVNATGAISTGGVGLASGTFRLAISVIAAP
jgi:hypothetical protein